MKYNPSSEGTNKMKAPSNPLLLPETPDDLSKTKTAASRGALSPDELVDIKHLLNRARAPSISSNHSSLSGSRVLVPVTSKAMFEGTLEPTLSASGDTPGEKFVIHVGDGKFEEMSCEQARQFFDAQTDKLMPKPTSQTNASLDQKASGSKGTKKSIESLKTKTTSHKESSPDDRLPLMEIREEWDESNTGPVRSEVVNISKQMERLNAGLNKAKNAGNDESGEQFGKLLAEMLKDDEIGVQSHDIKDEIEDTIARSNEDTITETSQPTRVSEEEYKSIYSRLEELEKLEAEELMSTKKSINTKNSSKKNSSNKGWSKGFLNAKPKKKVKPKQQTSVSPQLKEDASLASDIKMPMKQPTMQDTSVFDTKTPKVSFSKDVNVKEISPRARTDPEPNYFEQPKEFDPFPTVETVPFEENIFRGVVKERVSSKPMPEEDKKQNGEKRLSRFAMQRLQQGLS